MRTRGAGITTTESLLLGRTASAAVDRRKYRHDWYVTVFWSEQTKRWLCTVKAGFVNGDCPVVRTTAEEQEGNDPQWGINPLTGEPYFSASVFNRNTKPKGDPKQVDIPLYLDPALPLLWRKVGSDGSVGAPLFFTRRGVAPPQGLGDEPADPATRRLLRDCDIILHQPRPALAVETQFSPGILTGMSNVRQVLSVAPPDNGDVLQVQAVAGYDPQGANTIDPLTGTYTERNYDELWLATVYMLSPRGAPANADPDRSWTPHVRHRRFFSVNWDRPHRKIAPLVEDLTPYYLGAVIGGLAQPIVNTFTAAVNDAAQMALNMANGQSLKGYFWTPTGGGHDVERTPPPPIAANGLTKAGRRAAVEAANRQRLAERLEPAFPWPADPFPVALLNQ